MSHFSKHLAGIKSVNVSSEMPTDQAFLLTAAIIGLASTLGDVFQDEMETLQDAYKVLYNMGDDLPSGKGRVHPIGRLRKTTEDVSLLVENRMNRLKRAVSQTF